MIHENRCTFHEQFNASVALNGSFIVIEQKKGFNEIDWKNNGGEGPQGLRSPAFCNKTTYQSHT